MGIEDIENLTVGDLIEKIRNVDRDDYHVVLVGKAGKDKRGIGVYLVGPGSRPNAIFTGEKAFRGEFKVATNVALRSSIEKTGTVGECKEFIDRLESLMNENLANEGDNGQS